MESPSAGLARTKRTPIASIKFRGSSSSNPFKPSLNFTHGIRSNNMGPSKIEFRDKGSDYIRVSAVSGGGVGGNGGVRNSGAGGSGGGGSEADANQWSFLSWCHRQSDFLGSDRMKSRKILGHREFPNASYYGKPSNQDLFSKVLSRIVVVEAAKSGQYGTVVRSLHEDGNGGIDVSLI